VWCDGKPRLRVSARHPGRRTKGWGTLETARDLDASRLEGHHLLSLSDYGGRQLGLLGWAAAAPVPATNPDPSLKQRRWRGRNEEMSLGAQAAA
jgi:hypothetical protein